MPLILWKPELSVKVRELDGQHQKLIALINDLDEAMAQGQSKAIMGAIISELARYTSTHFAHEEELLARFDYPGTAAQLAGHAAFIEDVARFQRGFEAGKLGLSIQVMDFLSDWLTKHIMGTDQQYSAFLNERGIT